jgi:predicted nucleic acid-binding protein
MAVLDTNVLISAALKPLGRQALVINLVAFRAVELYVAEAVLAEYREVFSRPKFAHIDLKEVSQRNLFETDGLQRNGRKSLLRLNWAVRQRPATRL